MWNDRRNLLFWFGMVGLGAPVIVTLAAADQPLPAEISPVEWTKLRTGAVVVHERIVHDAEGKAHGAGVAYVLIHAPTEAVWSTILDFDRYSEVFPRVATCKQTFRDEREVDAAFRLNVLFLKIHYSIRYFYDWAHGKVAWILDDRVKNDIRGTTGFWEVRPEGKDSTAVAYSLTVDSGWFVPQSLEDFLAKRDLPDVVEALRKRVESGGKWRRGSPKGRSGGARVF